MNIEPTTIVILGITGDLSQKKILPALYDLYVSKNLPTGTRIVGFSRKEFTQAEIKLFVAQTLPPDFDMTFLDIISYVSGQYNDLESYKKLSTHIGQSHKIFYLSVPPTLHETIATYLSASGLGVSSENIYSRILIEKPFGIDLESAQKLDTLLLTLFSPEQIFRIDHYLAKDSVADIITKRQSTPETISHWNNTYVKKVEINLFETAIVGSRGPFYDTVGALCDVGQNHMLQMLALVAMDIPQDSSFLTAGEIQTARANVLEHLVPFEPLSGHMYRAQYNGYRFEPGVRSDSLTETFFSLTAYIDTSTFRGVPFVLSAGKALQKNISEVIIYFENTKGEKNILRFDISGRLHSSGYQKIFQDAIAGDQRVFVSSREAIAEWAFVTPIVEYFKLLSPKTYPIGSDPKHILVG